MRIFEHILCSSSGKRMRVREMEGRDQDWEEEEGKERTRRKQTRHNQEVTMMRERKRLNGKDPFIHHPPSTILNSLISAPPAPQPHDSATEALINTAPRRQGRPRKEATAPKTIVTTQPEQQPPQPLQQQLQPTPQHSQQQQGPSSTRPKTMAPTSQPSHNLRQSQRLRNRLQQQQFDDHALSSQPPAAP